MFDKVFISYAKEDFELAEKLYDYLNAKGFKPWLDKKNLLPGQPWDSEIKRNLREATYVILLLSSISVNKRGYVQREFRLALKYYEEKLEDDIYLIPIKLNKCHVPESLSSFQWIELSEDTSFETILKSLQIQQNKYLADYNLQINAGKTFEIEEFSSEYSYSVGKVSLKIETKYFQFVNNNKESLKELNDFIRGINTSSILESRSDLLAAGPADWESNQQGEVISDNWNFDYTISLNYMDASIVSLIENSYSYSGGVHGSSAIIGHNFFISPAFRVNIRDLFDHRDYGIVLDLISEYCFQELRKIYNERFGTSIEEISRQDRSIFWENSLDSEWENFENFLIAKNSISIIFNEYQVSSYVFGSQIIDIPLDEFRKLNIKNSLISRLL